MKQDEKKQFHDKLLKDIGPENLNGMFVLAMYCEACPQQGRLVYQTLDSKNRQECIQKLAQQYNAKDDGPVTYTLNTLATIDPTIDIQALTAKHASPADPSAPAEPDSKAELPPAETPEVVVAPLAPPSPLGFEPSLLPVLSPAPAAAVAEHPIFFPAIDEKSSNGEGSVLNWMTEVFVRLHGSAQTLPVRSARDEALSRARQYTGSAFASLALDRFAEEYRLARFLLDVLESSLPTLGLEKSCALMRQAYEAYRVEQSQDPAVSANPFLRRFSPTEFFTRALGFMGVQRPPEKPEGLLTAQLDEKAALSPREFVSRVATVLEIPRAYWPCEGTLLALDLRSRDPRVEALNALALKFWTDNAKAQNVALQFVGSDHDFKHFVQSRQLDITPQSLSQGSVVPVKLTPTPQGLCQEFSAQYFINVISDQNDWPNDVAQDVLHFLPQNLDFSLAQNQDVALKVLQTLTSQQ